MVELILEDYCQECKEIDLKTDIETLENGEVSRNGHVTNDTGDNLVYIRAYCSKAKRCAAQVRYLERRYHWNGNVSK